MCHGELEIEKRKTLYLGRTKSRNRSIRDEGWLRVELAFIPSPEGFLRPLFAATRRRVPGGR